MKTLATLLILSLLSITAKAGILDALVDNEMESINQKVAADTIAQYNIAKDQGDKMQICVQAGMVSAAYLQAKDSAKYKEWKAIEKKDCRNAGLPQ